MPVQPDPHIPPLLALTFGLLAIAAVLALILARSRENEARDKAAIRARLEAEADAREQAHKATVEEVGGVCRTVPPGDTSDPTLVSAGVVMPTPRTGTPMPPAAFDAIDERYRAQAEAEIMGPSHDDPDPRKRRA